MKVSYVVRERGFRVGWPEQGIPRVAIHLPFAEVFPECQALGRILAVHVGRTLLARDKTAQLSLSALAATAGGANPNYAEFDQFGLEYPWGGTSLVDTETLLEFQGKQVPTEELGRPAHVLCAG